MEWNQVLFDKWLHLREEFKALKKQKRYDDYIATGQEIIELARRAKFIGIMIPLFQYDLAKANEILGKLDESEKCYADARKGFVHIRQEERLAHPGDWLAEIARIDRAVQRIRGKKAV
jgi:hypothetical protein